MGIFIRRHQPGVSSPQSQWVGQATDRDSYNKRMRQWGASRSCDLFGDDYIYQGPAGACDGRAQVTLGYRSGDQSD